MGTSKKPTKLNTDLDKTKLQDEDLLLEVDLAASGEEIIEDAGKEDAVDDVMYTMGEILIADDQGADDENEDAVILQSAQKKKTDDEDAEEDEDDVFLDDELFDDKDDFLDSEDFDPEEWDD